MEERKRTPVQFDEIDVKILRFIDDKISKQEKITITDVKNFTGLTHANLVTHMKKLTDGSDLVPPLIKRERDKQTIYLSFTEMGEKAMAIFREAWQRGQEGKPLGDDLKDRANNLDTKSDNYP